jgi:deoxyadenosine/deoxycytidine kinase
LYKKVYANLAFDVPTPDLLIYLQAPTDVLVKRIKKRGIRYELNIDKIYLEKLNNLYTTFFHKYSRTALLIINAAEINPVDDESHYRALVNQILRIKAGKHYFNPLLEAL